MLQLRTRGASCLESAAGPTHGRVRAELPGTPLQPAGLAGAAATQHRYCSLLTSHPGLDFILLLLPPHTSPAVLSFLSPVAFCSCQLAGAALQGHSVGGSMSEAPLPTLGAQNVQNRPGGDKIAQTLPAHARELPACSSCLTPLCTVRLPRWHPLGRAHGGHSLSLTGRCWHHSSAGFSMLSFHAALWPLLPAPSPGRCPLKWGQSCPAGVNSFSFSPY